MLEVAERLVDPWYLPYRGRRTGVVMKFLLVVVMVVMTLGDDAIGCVYY